VIEGIKARYFDRFVEKHEGPWRWEYFLQGCEFIELQGHRVLLPVERKRHQNISLIRCLESRDGQSLTIFLKDVTHVFDEREWAWAGFVAVCDKFDGEDFFIAIPYHEWFIIDEMARRKAPSS
jgi:hypothetical protein